MKQLLEALNSTESTIAVAAPGSTAGHWAGGPSALFSGGEFWLAYRLRRPVGLGRGYANVVARSGDGVRFETVATLTSDQFACASLERPALVRRPDGGWRIYVSCSTPGSKHWWVEAVDADTPEELSDGKRTVVLPGGPREAWKDVVVRARPEGWQLWGCRHPLDDGDDEADRMSSWYATSADGLRWELQGSALEPLPRTWYGRGTRIADVVQTDEGAWWALFDGRASAAENWHERSGLAHGSGPGSFTPVAGPVPASAGAALRYASVVALPDGWRVYVEADSGSGVHDLRTVYVPRPSKPSQSE